MAFIQNILPILSLLGFLLFAELSAGSLKELAPKLSLWVSPKQDGEKWKKIALLFFSFAGAIPLLSFSIACLLFLEDKAELSVDLIAGAILGTNIIALALLFGLILYSSRLTFFRIRTMSSPVFLFLATMAFILVCLDRKISFVEGVFLWILAIVYSLYFRSFSREEKYYERHSRKNASKESFVSIFVYLSMHIIFFIASILSANAFVLWLADWLMENNYSSLLVGAKVIALLISLPWIIRVLFTLSKSDTQKAMSVTSITHICLTNILFLPGVLSLFWVIELSSSTVSTQLPILLFFTGIYTVTVLIEKQEGRMLPTFILFSYFIYLAAGVIL